LEIWRLGLFVIPYPVSGGRGVGVNVGNVNQIYLRPMMEPMLHASDDEASVCTAMALIPGIPMFLQSQTSNNILNEMKLK